MSKHCFPFLLECFMVIVRHFCVQVTKYFIILGYNTLLGNNVERLSLLYNCKTDKYNEIMIIRLLKDIEIFEQFDIFFTKACSQITKLPQCHFWLNNATFIILTSEVAPWTLVLRSTPEVALNPWRCAF